jgi:TolB-like protein
VLVVVLSLGVAAASAQQRHVVALLPFENISGNVRSLAIVMPLLERAVRERGYELIPEQRLEPFLFRHQVRPTSLPSRRHIELMREELRADLAMLGSVTLYNDSAANPQWGLSARMVTTGDATIVWARSAGLTGEEFTVALGLGTVKSGERLAGKTVDALVRSVPTAGAPFAVPSPQFPGTLQRVPIPSSVLGFVIPFGFKAGYRSRTLQAEGPRRVAVLPFENRSERKGAARIVTDVFVTGLFQRGRFDVIDPGVVDDALAQIGAAPFGVVDQPTLEGLRDRIGADAVIVGTVYNYSEGIKQGGTTSPELEMDARMLDTATGTILWSAAHGRKGDDYEIFLEFGKARSAISLVEKVTGEMLKTL